mgnify:CR=1 FL=1
MIKTHDRQGILDYFKELGMEISSTSFKGWYLDMICYPITDYNGSIHLYEIANLENDKLYKLIREVKRFDDNGRYWLTEKNKANAVKIPYGKVLEKDCISIIDNYTYNFKQAKMRFKKEKIERICREEDCD